MATGGTEGATLHIPVQHPVNVYNIGAVLTVEIWRCTYLLAYPLYTASDRSGVIADRRVPSVVAIVVAIAEFFNS
jgi:hypothetical protein